MRFVMYNHTYTGPPSRTAQIAVCSSGKLYICPTSIIFQKCCYIVGDLDFKQYERSETACCAT